MNKKIILLFFIVIILTICSFIYTKIKTSSDNLRDKPNVILIMIDALRPDHLSCYGYFRETSPNIDRLAKDGVIFTQAFVQVPATKPSVASVLTSLYPRQHYVWDMHGERGLERLDSSLFTIPEILRKKGYKTIAVVSNGFLDSTFGFNQGFDEYYETWKLPEVENHLAKAGHTTEMIIPWIEKNKEERFFMLLFFIDPHDPYSPPQSFDGKYQKHYKGKSKAKADAHYLTEVVYGRESLSPGDVDYLKALYDEEIAYVDYHIGKLLGLLKQQNILENTIIVLTADHGEEFMDHGGALHGYAIYNEHLHVPLIVSGQRVPQARKKVTSTVRSIDIMPTILELAGISAPWGIQGRSLRPLMDGGSREEDRAVFAELNLKGAYNDLSLVSIQKNKWKLIIDILGPDKKKQLYNIGIDPGETCNLITEHPKEARKLFRELNKFLRYTPRVRYEKSDEQIELDHSTIENLRSLGYLQ